MERWHGLDAVPPGWGPSVVTIGSFDGVHKGHQHLIRSAREAAVELRLPLVVVTFDPHPMSVVRPGGGPPRLASLHRRLFLLEGLDVDAVCVLHFTAEFGQLSPEQFVEQVLVQRLHARIVVVGEGFRFGHRAAGTIDTLVACGEQHGFSVEAVSLVGDSLAAYSSTAIREALRIGEVGIAADILGRPYRVEGQVVRGDRRGRQLGYPTANLALDPDIAVPADGVYAGWLVRRGEQMPAAVSVGTNPTFDGTVRRVEAFVIDRFGLQLYDAHVGIDFVARLRGQVRFGSVDDLVAQVAQDVERTRAVLRM